MPINWDKFQEDLDGFVEDAGGRTDRKLAGKVAAVTRLTDDEIRKLFPDPADVKKLAELIEIVKRPGTRNETVNAIVANTEKFGWIILPVLSKLA